jgi:hypothetical protein
MATALAAHAVTPDRDDDPLAVGASLAGRFALLCRTAARAMRHACGSPTTAPLADVVSAVVTPLPGGSRLLVEPAAPLEPGTRYRLVAPLSAGIVTTVPEANRDGVLELGATPPPAPVLPDFTDVARATWDAAAQRRTLPVLPEVLLVLQHPVALERLAASRIAFRRETTGASDPAHGLRLATAPGTLGDLREPARRTGAARADSASPSPADLPDAAPQRSVEAFVGRFPSRDLARDRDRSLPFRLAVPTGDVRAVVVQLNGVNAPAATLFREEAAGFAAHGLAVVAFDHPGQGERAEEGPLFDPRRPETLATSLRQAVFDVVALASALRAGDVLPAAVRERLRAAPLELFGYSFGAIVGELVLAAEPRFGTTVLAAPAGDVVSWVHLALIADAHVTTHVCVGPGVPRTPCGDAAHACAPGVACVINPGLHRYFPLTLAYRSILADVDPLTYAGALAGPDGHRPVLLLSGGRDGTIPPSSVERLVAAAHVSPTCSLDAGHRQTLCRFAELGHDVVYPAAPREATLAFLATQGARIGPGTPPDVASVVR